MWHGAYPICHGAEVKRQILKLKDVPSGLNPMADPPPSVLCVMSAAASSRLASGWSKSGRLDCVASELDRPGVVFSSVQFGWTCSRPCSMAARWYVSGINDKAPPLNLKDIASMGKSATVREGAHGMALRRT